jgi:hypothetical protein
MADYLVPPWVALVVIALAVGRVCIGFPGWARERLSHRPR